MFLKLGMRLDAVRASLVRLQCIPKKLLTVLILVGLWCIFLRHAFGVDNSFAIFPDNESLLGPVLHAMSTMLGHGELPLRMETILGGLPLYNSSQLSFFYPLYLAAFPIFKNPLEVIHSMQWITLGHILILNINMYIFLRVLGTSRLAAYTGAALVAFGANTLAYAVWVNIVAPYSWFPLYLAGLVGILRSPQSLGYSAMALGGIVLLTLASPAQPLIHAVFVTAVFVCSYSMSQFRNGETGHIFLSLRRLAVVGMLSLLIVAPVILPATLDFKDMTRWIGPFPPVIGNAHVPFKAFQYYQLSIADLGGVFFKIKGPAVGSQFVGVLPIALASVALVSRSRSWLLIALAFIGGYSVVSSTGSNLGLLYINYHLPLLNKIREPSRFLFLFQFAVSTLAALGIDELRESVSRVNAKSNRKRQLVALLMSAVLAVFILIAEKNRIQSTIPPFVSVAILLGLSLMTWLATRSNLWGRNAVVATVWGSVTLILLAVEVPWLPPPISSSLYFTDDEIALDAAIKQVSILDPGHEYRVIFGGEIDNQTAAMLASYRGVRTLNAYFNPLPSRQFEEMYYQGPRPDDYFGNLGAKYLICKGNCRAAASNGYKAIEYVAGYEIFETDDVLPQNYIIHPLSGKFTDFSDAEPNARSGLIESTKPSEGMCISREEVRTADRYRFEVNCSTSGVLVLNEFFDRAWKTTVDGVKVRSFEVNGNQIGVPFAPGLHVIDFRYTPRIFFISMRLMFVGILIFVLISALEIRRSWTGFVGRRNLVGKPPMSSPTHT
jgi:hypothetical protein